MKRPDRIALTAITAFALAAGFAAGRPRGDRQPAATGRAALRRPGQHDGRGSGADQSNALLLAQYPTATWFTGGTPQEVADDAATLVGSAKAAGQVPVIVAYNLPNRDCGQYSAGGAQSLADHKAWIAGFATGIDGGPAVVVLEPAGLGLIPNYTDSDDDGGNCTIAGAGPADRFAALNYAVDTLKSGANTSVYRDATHSGWQNIGAAAQRLLKAGVSNADGFSLNASNYQWTVNQVFYGTRIRSLGRSGVSAPGWCRRRPPCARVVEAPNRLIPARTAVPATPCPPPAPGTSAREVRRPPRGHRRGCAPRPGGGPPLPGPGQLTRIERPERSTRWRDID